MYRVFMTRTFSRWARKSSLRDHDLIRAVEEMKQGLIDANLGGGVFKKRVPLSGRGKRGGARVLVATQMRGHWFFLYGFVKGERANIDDRELKFLQETARDLLGLSERQISIAISSSELTEVTDEKEDQ